MCNQLRWPPPASLISRASTQTNWRFLLFVGTVLCISSSVLSAQNVTFAGTTPSVNFGTANLCAAGQTTPAPCNTTQTLIYKVTESGTLGTPKVLTLGTPDLDFTLASGSTCTGSVSAGSTCAVNVTFAPRFAGSRRGGVQITSESGEVLATTLIYGSGSGPQITFAGGIQTTLALSLQATSTDATIIANVDPEATAVDGGGNVFIATYNGVLENPANGGPEITLDADLLVSGVAIDGAGNLYLATGIQGIVPTAIYELPADGSSRIKLPFPALQSAGGIAVDGAGDVFVAGGDSEGNVYELEVGAASAVTLPFSGLGNHAGSVAVDGAGNVFVTAQNGIFELPAGSSSQVYLPFTQANGVAVDGGGDVFTAYYLLLENSNELVEIPSGSHTPLMVEGISSTLGEFVFDMSLDSGGNVVIGTSFSVGVVQRSQAPGLNFGGLVLGTATTLPLTLSNAGNKTLKITPSFSGPGYEVASTEPSGCMEGTAPGKNCTLEVAFSPDAATLQDAVLTLESNGAANPTVTLQGAGVVAAPVLSLPSGVYASAQTVSVTDAEPGAAIFYTTDGSMPTVSSTPYTGPISVSATERISAIAVLYASASILETTASTVGTASYAINSAPAAGVLNFSGGFSGPSMQLNGSAALADGRLELTNGTAAQNGSAFFATPVSVTAFTTYFTFLLSNPNADGITFTIQGAGAKALGLFGGGLGYAGIAHSVAIKFDLHNDAGEGSNSTGLYTDGTAPTVPADNLTGSGIDLHSGDPMLAELAYDGTNLVLTLTDSVTFATWSKTFAISIPDTVGAKAYVGFTGGTGDETAIQEILSWTYIAVAPGSSVPAPSTLNASSLPYYPGGFDSVGIARNGSATLSGTALQLTDLGKSEAGSAFFSTPVNVESFTTDFTFTQVTPIRDTPANGLTFTIQTAGLNALGSDGAGLGYAGIGKSVAFKIDLFSSLNLTDDVATAGVYTDGVLSTDIQSILDDFYVTFINVWVGDPIHAHITYDGANMAVTLLDTVSQALWSDSFPIDIPSTVGGSKAYVGFTGATGGETATQQILNWTYTNP